MTKQFKFDKDRIALIFLTIIFAVIFRLLISNIPFVPDILVSPVLGLLLAQYVLERKVDFKEAVLFFFVMIGVGLLIQFIPNITNFTLFTLMYKPDTGFAFGLGWYFIQIPIAVIVSDFITDKVKFFRKKK